MDPGVANDLNKAFICTTLHLSPREYEKLTVKDITVIGSYLEAKMERQKIEADMNKNW